jgi:hypothetical protein
MQVPSVEPHQHSPADDLSVTGASLSPCLCCVAMWCLQAARGHMWRSSPVAFTGKRQFLELPNTSTPCMCRAALSRL